MNSKVRILIIENKAVAPSEIEKMLLDHGYSRISVIDSSDKAIQQCRSEKPDLVLLDFSVNGNKDGFEISKLIRNDFGIPVILLIDQQDEENLDRVKLTMPFSHLSKPLRSRDLESTIELSIHVAQVEADRKQTELLLKDSEKRLKDTQKMAGIGYWDWFMDSGELKWSDEVYTIFGQNPKSFKVTADSFESAIYPDDLPDFLDQREKALATNQNLDVEHRIVLPDSSIRWVHEIAELIFDDQGQLTRIMGTVQDITRQKESETNLTELKEFYLSILEKVEDGIWVTDNNDELIFFNPGMEKIAGIKTDEVLGFNVIRDFPEETIKHFIRFYDRAKATLIPQQYEASVTIPDGRKSIQSGWLIPRLKNGLYDGMICTTLDITEQREAEIELSFKEKRYQELFNEMTNGVAVYKAVDEGQDFIFTDFNKAGAQIENVSKEDVIGKSVLEVFPGVKKFGLFAVFQRVWKTGIPESHPITFYEDTRIIGWRRNFVYKLPSEEVVAIYDDITEQKQAEQALKLSEAKYRSLFDSMNEGVCLHEILTDDNGKAVDYRIVDVNPKYEEITKLEKDAILNKLASQIYGSDEPPYLDIYSQVALTGKPKQFETYFPPMEKHFLISVFSPEKGKFATVFEDITDRKESEQKSQEAYKRLTTILDSIPADIYVSDMESYEILYMNAHMKDSFGQGLTGDTCWRVFRNNAEPCEHCPVSVLLTENKQSNGVKTWEVSNPVNNKNYINYDRAVSWIDDRLVHIQIAMDITERKTAEEALRKAHDYLELEVEKRTTDYRKAMESAKHANKLKSEFLANISHELRTPMHAILNYSKYGTEKYGRIEKEKNLHYFQSINKAGKRLMSLLDNLLDLSKLEAGKVDYLFEPIMILKVIHDAASEMQPVLKEKGIFVKLPTPDFETTIVGDEYKIGQVIRNLLSNAIRYSNEHHTVTLQVEKSTIDRKNQSIPALDIMIKDQGIGIPEEELGSIFEKFSQSSRTKTGAGGTGLGLAICKEILFAHKGKIWAENNSDGGATFYIRFPINR